MVRAALARVPFPPAPQDGVKDGIREWNFTFCLFWHWGTRWTKHRFARVWALLGALVGPSRSSIGARTHLVTLSHTKYPFLSRELTLSVGVSQAWVLGCQKAVSFNPLKL